MTRNHLQSVLVTEQPPLLQRSRDLAPPGVGPVERGCTRFRRQSLQSAALLVCALAAAQQPLDAQAQARERPGSALDVHRLLDAAVRRTDVPGMMLVVTDATDVIVEHMNGKLNVAANRPMTADAIFRIASMTKPVTSTVIMMLAEEGRLRLDERAAAYLPSLGMKEVMTGAKVGDRYATRPVRRAITIRDLLTHTSGIGYAFSDPKLFDLERAGQPEKGFPLLHDPGDRWTYGAGTTYLGEIIERVTGQPLDVVFRTRVFTPLGMIDTGYEVAPDKRYRLVTMHQRRDTGLIELTNREDPRNAIRGDGGLFSTARDYSAFLRLFLNGGRVGSRQILSDATIREMTRDQLRGIALRLQPAADAALTRPFPLGAGRDTWGLGFQIAVGPPVAFRRSAGSLSWAGLGNTYFWIDLRRGVGVTVMMQLLPFYDEQCIRLLTDVEDTVNRYLDARP